jgi:lysophospholipase
MRDLLTRINIAGFDAGAYIDKHKDNTTALPNVAIAFSGGGYRAMTNGAGALAAFDSRTPSATGSGQLGGLLQASTYIAGLSGGGWLVGSVYTNNFSSVQSIVDKSEIWQFDRSILQGKSLCFLQPKHPLTLDRSQAGWHSSPEHRRLLFRLI